MKINLFLSKILEGNRQTFIQKLAISKAYNLTLDTYTNKT